MHAGKLLDGRPAVCLWVFGLGTITSESAPLTKLKKKKNAQSFERHHFHVSTLSEQADGRAIFGSGSCATLELTFLLRKRCPPSAATTFATNVCTMSTHSEKA